jgi:hypothetical protein
MGLGTNPTVLAVMAMLFPEIAEQDGILDDIPAVAPELEDAKDGREGEADQVMHSDVTCKQNSKLQTLSVANSFL